MASEGRFGGFAGAARFIDRDERPARAPGSWRHPQAAARSTAPEDGGRFVDHDFFDDQPEIDASEVALRRGSRVRHDRFGEGEVVRVVGVGEPAVVAFFPGWGEKKILARFLKPAG
jgi:DNA helicase-2/ATP-dependent DNA helicase PcrA